LVPNSSHVKPWLGRCAQHCLYRHFLPIADAVAVGFTPGFRPKPIPEHDGVKLRPEASRIVKRRGVPAFHGLMLIRDEDDIIEQCLKHLLTWIDAVYVLDLGSTDETWNIVRDLASREKRIIPVRSATRVFSNALRASLFQEFRGRFSDGDWVLRLDADEFYHIPPPTFINDRIWERETCIYLGWYFFRLTSVELEAYESGRVTVMADRARPIEERRRFFKVTEHAEPRLFRYRPAMKWSSAGSFPYHAGYVARERIPIRHYPHRDPLQMEKRYQLRSK